MKGFIVAIMLAVIAEPLFAQTMSLEDRLRQAYQLGWEGKEQEGMALINDISEDDITNLSDSIRYLFYYTKAGILDSMQEEETTDTDTLMLRYVNEAISLREKSIGVRHSEYLELLWVKGCELEKSNVDAAMKAYQRGVVVGQNMVGKGNSAINHWYGQLLTSLGAIYENRNYLDQAISLYREGYSLASKDYIPDETPESWVPLLQLELLYYNSGQYDKSVAVCDELQTLFENHDGSTSQDYAEVLYFKGNSLCELENFTEGIKCYEKSISIWKIYDIYEEHLGNVYGNLYVAYLSSRDYERAEQLENAVIDYYTHQNCYSRIIDYFYAASNIIDKSGDLSLAERYLSKSIPFLSYVEPQIQEVVFSRMAKYRIRQKDVDGAILYKQKAIEVSEEEGKRFSNKLDLCYFISIDNPQQALSQYFEVKEELQKNKFESSPLYSRAINNITNLYLTHENYIEAIPFLNTTIEYIKSLSETDNRIVAECQNLIGVCQLKLNQIESARLSFFDCKSLLEIIGEINTDLYATALHNLGRAYMLLGNDIEAKDYLLRSQSLQTEINGQVMDRTKQYLEELGITE